MCDIMTALSVAGTVMSASASMQQAQDARNLAAYNKQVSDYQAKDTLDRGAVEEQKQREKVRQFMGSQRAAMGASGVEVASGSFGDVLVQSAQMGERDALTIRNNAMRAAWGYRTQGEAQQFEGEARARAYQGQAVGSLLTGGGNVYARGVKKGWWED
ncbi:hypothetical protein UFOVP456_41 [uncultured Caudovirales phage]|jgi:hypothetical protein|uniref:Uncharacterized protein n=1 Tax=uncultured Caudovirales phage TaxID=2100421 RepID=A0A6J5MBJ2_9CAUD|nr:hypothetical protein UFOVP456_41 [uncultured Caudovirales phage]